MSYSLPLFGKHFNQVNRHQRRQIAKHITPSLQFLDEDWYNAWENNHLAHEHPHSRIEYLPLLDNDGNLHGTFPYVGHSKVGLRILSIAGLYYPFRSILFSSPSADDCSQAFVNTICKNNSDCIIRIGPTIEDGLANEMICKLFKKRGWNCYEIDRGNTLVIDLPDTVEQFRQNLKRKFLKNIARSERNINKLGKFECHRYNNCSSSVWSKVIDQCSSVEKRSWLAEDENGEMRIFQNQNFWKEYLQSPDASRRAVIWTITLDGEPVAFSFAIDSGSCRYSFSGHYDKNYYKYGLGILADSYMYEDAIDCKISSIDMGTGEADYKIRWGAKLDSRIVDYIYFPPTFAGRLLYSGLLMRNRIRSKIHAFLS